MKSKTTVRTAWQICIAVIAIVLLAVGGADGTRMAAAQGQEHHAGLVVQFSDGSVQQYCMAFSEESISGLDLLLKTGLDVKMEAYGGMGGAVCKIGQVGCDYPGQACWCLSYGPGGVYWSYHHLKDGQWKSSSVGASSYKVHNGDVDGWAWSDGKPPALRTFGQVCGAVLPEAISTRGVATVAPTSVRVQTTVTARPRPTQTKRPVATSTTTHTQVPGATTQPVREDTASPTISQWTPTSMPIATSTPTFAPTTQPSVTPALRGTPVAAVTEAATPGPVVTSTKDDDQGRARTVAIVIGLGAALAFVLWRGVAMMRPGNKGRHVD